MDIDDESEPYDPPKNYKKSLGLINGTYQIRSPDIEGEWPHAMPSEGISLSLRLNGKEVWGTYHFGVFDGVLWMPQRPMKASTEEIPFQWRGRDTGTGEMSFGPYNEGWIMFLGDGEIAGAINCMGNLKFRGQRASSDVRTASELRNEWDGYNEEEYERERTSRW
jgi:hypothetical protein